MATLVLIIEGLVIALIFLRPAQRPQVVCVPVAINPERRGLGCLPLIVGAVLVLLILGIIRF